MEEAHEAAILTSIIDLNLNDDYIYEAALEFSNALQAEVNCDYKQAFDKYKKGIDCLLSGAKCDTNLERRRIAKEKTEKYLLKAEEIYDKYILINDQFEFITYKDLLQLTPTTTLDNQHSSIYLERPISQLSKFKVVKIIDNCMQVQDVTDKKLYIMKVIEKFPVYKQKNIYFLPKNIPYMIELISFYPSENSIYLLLKQAR